MQRRKVAAPFVVTVSVFSGCASCQKAPPPEPEKTVIVVPEPTEEIAESEPDAAVEPQPERPNRTAKAQWTISKNGDRCQSSPVSDCPPTAKCNPPEPLAYTCPAG